MFPLFCTWKIKGQPQSDGEEARGRSLTSAPLSSCILTPVPFLPPPLPIHPWHTLGTSSTDFPKNGPGTHLPISHVKASVCCRVHCHCEMRITSFTTCHMSRVTSWEGSWLRVLNRCVYKEVHWCCCAVGCAITRVSCFGLNGYILSPDGT